MQDEQQVRSRLHIQVSVFMALMHTCHVMTINTSVPLLFPILLPFYQVKPFSSPVTFLLCTELMKVTLDILLSMF